MKKYASTFLVTALLGSAFGCNNASDDASTVRTIDDLANPSAAPKACSGSFKHAGLEEAIKNGQIKTSGLSVSESKQALDKLRQGLSAVPTSLVAKHLGHGTIIVVSASANADCDANRGSGVALLADLSLKAKGLGGCALVTRKKAPDQSLEALNYTAVLDARHPHRVVEFFGMLAAEAAYLDDTGETIGTKKNDGLAALQKSMRAEIVGYVRNQGKATDAIDKVSDDQLLYEAAATSWCQPSEMAKLPNTKAALAASVGRVSADRAQLGLNAYNVQWGTPYGNWQYNGQQIGTVAQGQYAGGYGQDYYGSSGQYLGSWDRTYGADGRITYDGPTWYPY